MARRTRNANTSTKSKATNKDNLSGMIESLSADSRAKLSEFLATVLSAAADGDLSDLESGTKSRRGRKPKAEPEAEAKTTSRRGRRAATKASDDEAEDEKPKGRRRSSRKSAAAEEPAPKTTSRRGRRAAKQEEPEEDDTIEAFEEAPTVEDLYEFLDNYEGAPADGQIRDLRERVEEFGGDTKMLEEGIKERAARIEELGMFVAACEEIQAKLNLCKADELRELCDELGIESSRKKDDMVLDIIAAINDQSDEGEEADDEGADDEDEDDDGLEDVDDIEEID